MTNTPPTGTTPIPTVDPTATDAGTKSLQAQGAVVQQNTAYMEALDEKMTQSRNVLSIFTNTVNLGVTSFTGLSDSINSTMDELSKFSDVSQGTMTKFSAAVTAAFGATKSTFGGMNFDSLNTLGGQLDNLIDPIKNNSSALGMLADKMGVLLPSAIRDSAPLIAKFLKDTATSADNALKLEDSYVRAAAATGRLGDVHKTAGEHMEHINKTIADQRSALNQTIIATNLSKDTVEAYYNQLQQIPVALKDGVTHENAANISTAQLTKTIQLAKGTGREYSDILADMKEAVRDYNSSLPEAMKFTAQISEISGHYGIELKDVQESLKGTASAFKMFGNEAQGAATILNEYVGSLKATGLSGSAATEIVSGMTRQIGNLNIAQKAFLSGQSGGPGGLMGAYNIDMKLRSGKLDEVFNMAKNQLTKMMGPNIVSTEQAANSPQAAAQMTKQIMMLRQGPLGQFAKTDQEAERIIDAIKGGRSADFKPLLEGNKSVEDATKLGNDFAKQSATGISQIVAMMEEARGVASGGNLNMMQAGFTAGAGTEFEDQNLMGVQSRKAYISGNMEEAAKNVGNPSGEGFRSMENLKKVISQLPDEVSGAAEGIGQIVASEGAKGKGKTQTIGDYMAQNNPTSVPGFMKPQTSELGVPVITSGHQVGAAASTNANRGANAAANAPGQIATPHAHAANTSSPGPLGEILVKVEGFCIHCKEKIEGSDQSQSVSVGSRIRQ
jgi:hypothetical protein